MRHKSVAVFDPIFRLFSETVDLSDAADPGGDPGSHAGMLAEDSDEVSSDMGPAEGENESDDSGRSILVGGEAVGEEGAGPVGKLGEGDFRGTGGIDHVDDRIQGENNPEPPAVWARLAVVRLSFRVSENVVARLVGLGKRGGAASVHDLVVEGL